MIVQNQTSIDNKEGKLLVLKWKRVKGVIIRQKHAEQPNREVSLLMPPSFPCPAHDVRAPKELFSRTLCPKKQKCTDNSGSLLWSLIIIALRFSA